MKDKKPNPVVQFLVYRPWWVIISSLVLTGILGAGMAFLKFDADLSDDIPDTIPEKAFFDEVGRIFPSDDVLFVALKDEKGVFTPEYLRTITTWSQEFEQLPGIKGVISLATAGLIKGTEAGIEIRDALPEIPTDVAAMEAFRQTATSNALTKSLLGADGKSTALLITVKEGLDNKPVPVFSLELTAPPTEGLLEALKNLSSPRTVKALAATALDTAQFEGDPAQVSFSATPAAGLDPQSAQEALNQWVRSSGRADWQVVPGDTWTFTVKKNPNESWAKTREKIEAFLRAGEEVRALEDEGQATTSLAEILVPGAPDQEKKALVNYLIDIKGNSKPLVVLVPSPEADLKSLESWLKSQILLYFPESREGKLTLQNKGLPTYNRAQALIGLLDKPEGSTVYISGSKAVSTLLQGILGRDLGVLFVFVILIIMVVLYLSFRTLRGVLLPLANVILAVIWVLGLMGWIGVPLSQATFILPIILIAVGTAYTIHVINRNYEDLSHISDKREALVSTLTHVSVPVLLAGWTTVIGFGSFLLSTLSALQAFGGLAALGVFFGMVLSLTFSVSLLSVLGTPKLKTVSGHSDSFYTKALGATGRFVVAQPWTVVGISLGLVILAAVGIPRVKFEQNSLTSFDPSTEIRQSSEYLNDNFTGITVLNVIVKTPEEGAILEPKVLKAMDGLQAYLETLRVAGDKILEPGDAGYEGAKAIVGGSQSITTFLKGINKAFNADNPAFDRIPDEENPVAVTAEVYTWNPATQILTERDSETGEVLGIYTPGDELTLDTGAGTALLTAGSDPRKIDLATGKALDLIPGRTYTGQLVFQYESAGKPETIESFIDNPRQTARINVFLKTASSGLIFQIQEKTQKYIRSSFPEGVKADLTGLSQLTLTILKFLVETQLSSVLSSLLIILVGISLLSRSLVEGLFSIVPLTLAIGLNTGIMGWFGIPIDISTSTIAAIAIGIGIDYTLHFLERFKVMSRSLSLENAVVETLKTTGVGIFFNALAVAAGFAALLASQLMGNKYLGLLMMLIMVTSSVGAVTVLPALLLITKPKFLTKKVLKAEIHDGFSPENKISHPHNSTEGEKK